jgi:hypothetical protein
MVGGDVTTSQATVDQVEKAADVLEIHQLEASYAHLFDTGQGEVWAALFTGDGVFKVDAMGDRPAVTMIGPSELAARCIAFRAREVGLHFLAPPRIEIDGSSAQGLTEFRFHGVELATGNIRDSEGFYEVGYRKEEGHWAIAFRHEHPVRRGTKGRP